MCVAAGPVDDGTLAALYERARLLAYVPLDRRLRIPAGRSHAARGSRWWPAPCPASAGPVSSSIREKIDDIADGLVRAATDDGLRAELVAGGRLRGAGPDLAGVGPASTWLLWESLR